MFFFLSFPEVRKKEDGLAKFRDLILMRMEEQMALEPDGALHPSDYGAHPALVQAVWSLDLLQSLPEDQMCGEEELSLIHI